MTDTTPLQVFSNVAHNLRTTRLRLGWSQEKLALQADVSRRMLVNIEAGASNVSIATLDRLADAMGLTFSALVRAPGDEAPLRVWQGQNVNSHATLLQSLPLPGGTLELWEWQLQAGEHYLAEPDPAGCGEIVQVREGVLTVSYPGHRIPLGAGQSASYLTDQGYAYHNHGSSTVHFSRSILMPLPG